MCILVSVIVYGVGELVSRDEREGERVERAQRRGCFDCNIIYIY